MLSNILITFIVMIMLSLIISNIVSNYIEEDIKDDIIKENSVLVKWLSYNKFLKYDKNDLSVNLDYYEKMDKLPIVRAVFKLDDNPQLLDMAPSKLHEIIEVDEMKHMIEQEFENVYSIKINGKSYLAYNDNVIVEKSEQDHVLMVVTLLSNSIVDDITMQIIRVLVGAIIVVSILSVAITSLNERMITNPVKIIVKTTEKIAVKNFDEKVDLETGDEFETLASAINEMAESLKKQDIEQKKFYEHISHEIKTPLTVISGNAQGIKTNLFEDPNKALDTIIVECKRLKKQLENVIYLSKLDTVNESYNLQETSINGLIGNALEKLYSVIIINEIDIIFEPKTDAVLYVDQEKASRALINILSNCIKYTKDTIYINTDFAEGWVRLEISDNGNGFSKELLENPFSRTIIGEKEGSGIGLSIIKKVIDGHKGRVTLDNKKEGGALYVIELPL